MDDDSKEMVEVTRTGMFRDVGPTVGVREADLMRRRKLTTALMAATLIAWSGGEAAGQQPVRTGPQPGRYSDPHLSVYAWQGQATGQDALLFYLSSQYRQAQLMREEQAAGVIPPSPRTSPHYRMRPGGAAAGGYFGRTVVVGPSASPRAPSRYNRLGPYFGDRGR